MRHDTRRTNFLVALAFVCAAVGLWRAAHGDPPLGPSLKVVQGTNTVANAHILNFTSGCTLTPNGSEADVACLGSGGISTVTAHNGLTGSFAANTLTIGTVTNTKIAWVSCTTGNDTTASGDPIAPYATVQAAVNAACTPLNTPNTACQIHVMACGGPNFFYNEIVVLPATFQGYLSLSGDSMGEITIVDSFSYSPIDGTGAFISIHDLAFANLTLSGTAGTTAFADAELYNIGAGSLITLSSINTIQLFNSNLNKLALNEIVTGQISNVYIIGSQSTFIDSYNTANTLPNGTLNQGNLDVSFVVTDSVPTLSGRVTFLGQYIDSAGFTATALTGALSHQPTVQCERCALGGNVAVTYPDAVNGFAATAIDFDGTEIDGNLTINGTNATRITPTFKNGYMPSGTITLGSIVDLNANFGFVYNTTLSTSGGTLTQTEADVNFSGYSQAKAGGTGQHQQTFFTRASTVTASGSTITVDVGTGTGGGNYVIKACSDGVTCGAGNIYLTCTIGCTTAAGTVTGCSVTKAAIPASTTLTWTETTACTNDPGVNFNLHATTP